MSSSQSTWEKIKAGGRDLSNKIGAPVNAASNKLGAEAFWPESLDKEADKAASILRSFCLDGFLPDKHKDSKVQIPAEVIRHAKGLAIFTVFRAGLHWSGAGGSGIVVARTANGQWSAPSALLIHTLGWGLLAGADIYDCVCVINDEKGLEGFTRPRATLGGEVSAAVGPLGQGSNVESQLTHPEPVWTYTKSRGLYAGVAIDGTIVVERKSENEHFYGIKGVKNTTILSGEVQAPAGTMVQLWETLQAAEGREHDAGKLPPANGQTPGDHLVEEPQPGSNDAYNQLGSPPEERMDHKA